MSEVAFTDLTAGFWRKEADGWETVDWLMARDPEAMPAVIRALVASAPDGAL